MSEKKKDLTRIEDLSEFLHEDDPEVDKLLDKDEKEEQDQLDDLPTLDDLENEQAPPQIDEIKEFREHEEDRDPTNPGFETDNLESSAESQWQPESDDDGDEDWSSEESNAEWESPDEDNQQDFQHESSDEEESWSLDEDDPFQVDSSPSSDEQDDEESPDLFETPSGPEAETTQLEDEEGESEDDHEPESEENKDEENGSEFEQEVAQELAPESPEPVRETKTPQRKPPENFEDVKQFAQTMSYGHVGAGGNPPFSVMLKNIKYKEDAEDIISLLREHSIVDEQNLKTYEQSLENGALLISQISEYSAIYLAHRLRRFDLDVMVGLSDEIYPSKSYQPTHKGLLSKHNLRQNKIENVSLKQAPDGPEQILVATTPGLEGHRVHRYLGIISEHSLLKESDLENIQYSHTSYEELPLEKEITEVQEKIKSHWPDHKDQDDEIVEQYALSIQQVYGELTERLKSEAMKLKANAVVGISFHLTPLIDRPKGELENTYKITCTGNAVWVSASGDQE